MLISSAVQGEWEKQPVHGFLPGPSTVLTLQKREKPVESVNPASLLMKTDHTAFMSWMQPPTTQWMTSGP
jgi:hypothetical protein